MAQVGQKSETWKQKRANMRASVSMRVRVRACACARGGRGFSGLVAQMVRTEFNSDQLQENRDNHDNSE